MSGQGDEPPIGQHSYANAADDELARAMALEHGDDDAAWREFFKRYADKLMRVIRYAGRGLQQADREAVFSDTIVRIQAGVHAFKPKRLNAFQAWVYTIARNATMDWFRRDKAEFVTVDEIETLAVEEYEEPVPNPVFERATAARDRAFQLLPGHYQALLELGRAGYTDPEIAQRLGMAADRVRKVRYKAIERLRELLMKERDGR